MSSSLLPPILNPTSLYNEEAKRDATRIRIYNNVLQQIYNKIKAIARVPGNEKSLWYVVPEFIPGTPRFDIGDCIVYLVWNLRNVGYMVEYTHPNLMFISWRNHDSKYKESGSPWAQVLQSAREQVITAVDKSPTISAMRPATAPSISHSTAHTISHDTSTSEYKRKTILKKTNEYRPATATSNTPSYTTPPPTITGTISPRHVSFV